MLRCQLRAFCPLLVLTFLCVHFVLLVGCGGGGGTAAPTPTPVVQPTLASFSLQGDPSGLSVGPGKTGTMTVTVKPGQVGSTNYQVNLTFTGSDGITGTFNPPSVAPSGTSVLTTQVDPGLVPPFFTSLSVTGTRTGDGRAETSAFSNVLVLMGGGTMTFTITNLPLGTPTSVTTYIQNLLALITSKGGIYDLCGMASTSQVVEVRYDPSPHQFFFDGGYDSTTNRMHPVIHFGQLPNLGADGTDPNFDHAVAHEVSNALNGALHAGIAKGGNFNVRDRAELDPLAEACTVSVLRFMNTSGRKSAPVNESFDGTLLGDVFTNPKYFTMNELAGNSEVPGYDSGFQYPGFWMYSLLVGPNGFASVADYRNKYFNLMNQKGRLLTGAELRAFHNGNAVIDLTPAGDLIAAKFSIVYSPPTAVPGPILLPIPFRPQLPDADVTIAMHRDMTPPTVETATDVTSGPITLAAKSTNGAVYATVNTDLGNTGFGADFRPLFNQSVPNGNFNFVTTWFANDGVTIIKSKSIALCNIPFANVGSITNTAIGPSLVFVIAVHGADASAADATFNAADVTEGIMTYSAPGVVVVQAGASGEVTVRGNKYTAPANLGRTVYLPVD